MRAGGERRGIAENDRIAVRRGVSDLARADRAAAAGIAVFDHDALAERGAHLVGDRPRHDVVGAARRQRNDEDDRPVRIVVGRHQAGRAKAAIAATCRKDAHKLCQNRLPFHAVLHFLVAAAPGAGRYRPTLAGGLARCHVGLELQNAPPVSRASTMPHRQSRSDAPREPVAPEFHGDRDGGPTRTPAAANPPG